MEQLEFESLFDGKLLLNLLRFFVLFFSDSLNVRTFLKAEFCFVLQSTQIKYPYILKLEQSTYQ